eukprot:9976631-Alexandrium_andersonii.AAC.1
MVLQAVWAGAGPKAEQEQVHVSCLQGFYRAVCAVPSAEGPVHGAINAQRGHLPLACVVGQLLGNQSLVGFQMCLH